MANVWWGGKEETKEVSVRGMKRSYSLNLNEWYVNAMCTSTKTYPLSS